MVEENYVWHELAAIAREHLPFSIAKPGRQVAITRDTTIADDIGLQGELAEDFLTDVVTRFQNFELSEGRGDFVFERFFSSEISQSFARRLIYIFYPKVRDADRADKMRLTLGMIEDAIHRGYWETARYLKSTTK